MNSSRTVKTAGTLTLLAGAWLFVSPWIYAMRVSPETWNAWICGIVILTLAAIRIGTPQDRAWLSWLNCLIGAWTFLSPWVLRFTGHMGGLINTLCVGAFVFLVAMLSASATPRTRTPLVTGA
jgi:hypothetical protein